MRVEIFKLFKEGPILLHIGLRRMDRTSTIVHSDTLFSALSNSLIKLWGEEKFEIFEEKLVISSLFIGLRMPNFDILFVPMPDIFIKLPHDKSDQHKKYKKIQWISLKALGKILNFFDKENLSINLENLDDFSFLNSKFLVTKGEFEEIKEEIDFIGTILEPKVSVNRESSASENLFFQENLILWPIKTSNNVEIRPFLYFFKKEGPDLDSIFIPALNLFIEEGIGGERSTGKGIFDYYEKELTDLPDEGNLEITLSLTTPMREEVDNLIYYQIIKRDGFVFYNAPKGFRKKVHYKVKEGALVKSPYVGENINVSPVEELRVISYGKNLGYKFS